MKSKGKFIVIEGGEGSGKGSCINFLKRFFAGNKDVIFLREPGGTPYGEQLRSIFIDKDRKPISVLAELFTFCTIRANNCDLIIRPALENGKIVICDRFDPSTFAYQVAGRNQQRFKEIFEKINAYAKGLGTLGFVDPDLVILLDVKPEVGLARVKRRADDLTCFDVEELAFHYRVHEEYLRQAKENFNWFKIDTTELKVEDGQRIVLNKIISLMGEGGSK